MVTKDILNKRKELLDGYERSIGLQDKTAPGSYDELKSYLSLTKEQLSVLQPKDAVSIGIRLANFASYFRRCINEEKSNKTFAQSELNKIVAYECQQMDSFIKGEHKVALVAKVNQVAYDWLNILTYCNQRIERLDGVSEDIKNLGYMMSLLGKY